MRVLSTPLSSMIWSQKNVKIKKNICRSIKPTEPSLLWSRHYGLPFYIRSLHESYSKSNIIQIWFQEIFLLSLQNIYICKSLFMDNLENTLSNRISLQNSNAFRTHFAFLHIYHVGKIRWMTNRCQKHQRTAFKNLKMLCIPYFLK